MFNPRLTKGVVATPLRFSRLLYNAKESDLGHLSNLFYILCSHFDDKSWGESEGEGSGWSPAILEITILKNIFTVWSWILQYILET